MGSNVAVEIPTWAWGLFMTVFTLSLTGFGSILKSYNQSVDNRFKAHDKRISKNEQEIAVLKVVRR